MREVWPTSPFALLLIVMVFAYAGLLVIAPIYAIVDRTFEGGLEPVKTALEDPDAQHALQLSFRLSLGATLINTIFGVILAWVLVRHDFWGKRVVDALVDIPFVFSPVIFGYAMIILFGRTGWIESPFAIVFALPGMLIAKTFVTLPFVARETSPVLAAMSHQQEEAAYTLGASRWRVFWQIIMPIIWTGVLYGIVLTFARAVGEFGAVAVISGNIEGKTETATTFVYRALSDRNRIGAYSVSLLLGAMAIGILAVMAALNYLLTKRRGRTSHVNQAG